MNLSMTDIFDIKFRDVTNSTVRPKFLLMASPKIFVSSTCYDLSLLRGQLRNFIGALGYEPVMSDYSDVLYDPRTHTHTSCLKELPNCDGVVLVIGSRFGGRGIPEAISEIDFEALASAGYDLSSIKKKESLSVTQLEILKSIELGIPVYAFVDDKVLHDHHLYETNKNSGVIDKIKFPSIEKPETARFIFEFINFLRLRVRGNSVFGFSKHDDIEITLKRQWAALFQRLLTEQRQRVSEERRIDHMAEQFESLKTAILASIPNTDARDVARAVVRYRRVIDFLRCFEKAEPKILEKDQGFEELMKQLEIVKITDSPRRRGQSRQVFVCEDGTFYESRYRGPMFDSIISDWEAFRKLPLDTKRVVIDTSLEMGGTHLLQHTEEKYSEVIKEEEEDPVEARDRAELLRRYLDGMKAEQSENKD
jgi:hypothetical protein